MGAEFRKISRVRSLSGATRWYLSEDCLLAAKQVMYAVEYRRFYLRDIESIVVWPARAWIWRAGIPTLLLAGTGIALGLEVSVRVGAVFCVLALAWLGWELALGPTAQARIETSGAIVDLHLVKRARRAGKVLATIDAAIRAARGDAPEQPAARREAAHGAEPSSHPGTEAASVASPVTDLT